MDVTREVRRASRVPIIMPTAHVEELNKVLGPELGADDYVVKPFGARQLVARVRAVFRRLDEVAWAAAQGTVTVKTAPPSARFAAETVSPWAATIARAMARPLPPESVASMNHWKTSSGSAGPIPSASPATTMGARPSQ